MDTFVKSINDIPLDSINNTEQIEDIASLKEIREIRYLSQNSNIVIKKADKCGATFSMDTLFYQALTEKILHNTSY